MRRGKRLLAGVALAWATMVALPAWAAEDLRPLKPAVGPNLWLPALVAAGLALVLIGLASRLARRRSGEMQEGGETVEPPPPPASLRARLEQVRDAGWIEAGAHLKACETIAEVMRDLARVRWVISTPRLTTAELLGELAGRGAERAITGPLGDVLEACDLVKFAGARVPPESLRGHLETAFVLVDAYGASPGAAA